MFALVELVAVAGNDGTAVVGFDAPQIQAHIDGHLFVQTLAQQRMIDSGAQQEMRIEERARGEHHQIRVGPFAAAGAGVGHAARRPRTGFHAVDPGIEQQGDARIIVYVSQSVLDGEFRIHRTQFAHSARAAHAARAGGDSRAGGCRMVPAVRKMLLEYGVGVGKAVRRLRQGTRARHGAVDGPRDRHHLLDDAVVLLQVIVG